MIAKGSCMYSGIIRSTFVCVSAAILLIAGGCAHDAPKIAEEPIKPPKMPDESIQKSAALEFKGDITFAVEELKIALTIDPANQAAREQLSRLMEKRDKLAEGHYKAGLALKNTNLQGAKREFLMALRIRTDYQDAMKELKNLQLESSEATLQVRAKREAAASLRSQERAKTTYEEVDEETQTDRAIAIFEDGDYAGAIQELQKAKSHAPNDPEIAKYLNLSWYNLGITLFKKTEYQKALDAFAKVKKGFESLDSYEKKCRNELKNRVEELYKQGMKFFREQNLKEAVARWNAVLEIEPGHQKAKEYIEKANKLETALKKRN